MPLVAAGRAVCSRCLEPIDPSDEWDAGHVEDLVDGGRADGVVLPEHRACNRRAGARLGNQRRGGRRRRLAAWLESAARFFLTGPRPRHPALSRFSPHKIPGLSQDRRMTMHRPGWTGE